MCVLDCGLRYSKPEVAYTTLKIYGKQADEVKQSLVMFEGVVIASPLFVFEALL